MTNSQGLNGADAVRIAVLDDDPALLKLLGYWLEGAGYAVSTFRSASEFLSRIRNDAFALYMIDWELPDQDGPSVLREMRHRLQISNPVIFVTSRGTESDLEYGLDSGADDYLIKPAKERETLARIRSALRRAGVKGVPGSIWGNLELDASSRRVCINSSPVQLTPREFGLLTVLTANPNTAVSRDSLLTEVWGMRNPIATRTVDTHLSRLRTKLQAAGGEGFTIENVHGHGYVFRC